MHSGHRRQIDDECVVEYGAPRHLVLTVLRRTGRHADALCGYRDVLAYWQHAGNWIQVWTTLRNLADLLVELGDAETAGDLFAAADRAPDAPAVGDSAWEQPAFEPQLTGDSTATMMTRDEATTLAVATIDRHLGHEAPSSSDS